MSKHYLIIKTVGNTIESFDFVDKKEAKRLAGNYKAIKKILPGDVFIVKAKKLT